MPRSTHVFADLGSTPLANSFRSEAELGEMEPFYPLRAMVCERCFLVQLDEYETPDVIFSEYAYFSSYSTSWLEHAKRYAEMAIERFGLDGPRAASSRSPATTATCCSTSSSAAIPVLGIEPAANVAEVATANGHPHHGQVLRPRDRARGRGDHLQADLVIANNVLAHVPDLNDFVARLQARCWRRRASSRSSSRTCCT